MQQCQTCRTTFQSTLPVWGATIIIFSTNPPDEISIHAPRVGSDPTSQPTTAAIANFNPRSPCGERPGILVICYHPGEFQSTLPVWGATRNTYRATAERRNFNPRSPCGERLNLYIPGFAKFLFQSTLPVWGATIVLALRACGNEISIHAPRVGSDVFTPLKSNTTSYFNPRSPCGERRMISRRKIRL